MKTKTALHKITILLLAFALAAGMTPMAAFAAEAPTRKNESAPLGASEAPAAITIYPSVQAATQTVGEISGSFDVVATVSDGSTPTYQWYSFPSNTPIHGATSARYPFPTQLPAGRYAYYCIATSGSLTARSGDCFLWVKPALVATTTPTVVAPSFIALDLISKDFGFIPITLGANNVTGGVLAERVEITVSGSAVITNALESYLSDEVIIIAAESTGSATISIKFSGKDVVDNRYDRKITVLVTDGPINISSEGSSSSSSGGSNKADTRPVVGGTTTGTTTSKPLTKAEATKQFEAALAAKPAGATALSIKINNSTSVSKTVLAELAALAQKNGVTLTVHFDTVVGGKVVSRLSVNPATATGDLNVAITENKALAARFAKFYSNQLAAYTIPAAGSVAIKLPENLKPEDLVLYSYDPATNTYSQLTGAKLWVDSNGYLHFDVAAGTEVVISQGKLVKK